MITIKSSYIEEKFKLFKMKTDVSCFDHVNWQAQFVKSVPNIFRQVLRAEIKNLFIIMFIFGTVVIIDQMCLLGLCLFRFITNYVIYVHGTLPYAESRKCLEKNGLSLKFVVLVLT